MAGVTNSGLSAPPELSVVVTLTSGEPASLGRILESLKAQVGAPPFEIIVPHDPSAAAVTTPRHEHPAVRFVEAAGGDAGRGAAGGSREHHDAWRTLGITAARGRFVALVEDHEKVAATWCRDMVRLLEENPSAGAVGGAVEFDGVGAVARAVWACDFLRYALPFTDCDVPTVSDTNVVYRRTALEAVASAWSEAYHEPQVHAALRQRGLAIRLSPRSVTWQARERLAVGRALRERMVWGRSFGGHRARRWPAWRRFLLAPVCVVLPVLLAGRVLREAGARRRLGEILPLLPIILLLEAGWAVGEGIGTLTARPDARKP